VAELRGRLDAWRVQQGERLDFAPMPEDAKRGELPYRE
jgi:N-sulfoglucosamine sulfohydrolase